MTSTAGSKMSMIIDGIAASEAIDSSGEILDVKGCDISDFENGVGVLNYEHRGDEAQGASGNDIVGKIIYCKKIFKKDDCEDKRQEAYWNSVKLPFVYIRGRLYDGAGHAGAQALAAIIRDAVMHNEPILARFSIEGSTLKKEGQHLRKTIARKVAITLKPANKSAVSGLISDPNAPNKPITQKQADKSLLEQVLETAKHEIPGRQVLGSHTQLYQNLEVDTDPSQLLKMTAHNLRSLLKTMAAGQGGGAPSTLTGGAALQREDFRLHKDKLKNDLRAAVRDMPDSARVSKDEMLKFFKFKLPEVNEHFLDHFTDLIDDVRTRQVGDWVEKTMKVWGAVQKAEARVRAEVAPIEVPEPVIEKPIERVKELTKKLEAKIPTVKPEPVPEPEVEEDNTETVIRRIERMAIDLAFMAKEEAAYKPHEPGIVDSEAHVVPHYSIKDEHKKMVHGMNLNESDVEDPAHWTKNVRGTRGGMWHRLPSGKLGYVKHATIGGTDLPSESHAEVLYHNLLHHVGLGQYIMPTVLVRNPDAPPGEENPENYYSVQEAVPNAEHHFSQDHNKTLYDLERTGELQKIALANHLFGNTDRHAWNFLFGGKEGKNFYLIDHGMSFPRYQSGMYHSAYPSYLSLANQHAMNNQLPIGELHPDARKWLTGLNPEKLAEVLKSHQVGSDVSHAILTKLKHMQEYAQSEPEARFNEIWEAPNLAEGGPTYWGRSDVAKRAEKDPGVLGRYQKRIEDKKLQRAHVQADEDIKDATTKNVVKLLAEGIAQGKEGLVPYDLLKQQLGEKGAEDAIRPLGGPEDIQPYIKKFNNWVSIQASRQIHQVRQWKQQLAMKMVGQITAGKDPKQALNHVKGEELDKEAAFLRAPDRGNASDDEFKDKIVQWMIPEMKKMGLRVQ